MANDGNGDNDVDPLLQYLISPSVNPPPPLISSPEHNQSPPNSTHHGFYRSNSAPAMSAVINDVTLLVDHKTEQLDSKPIVRKAFALLIVYLSLGVFIYWLTRDGYAVIRTHPIVDGLYFCIVTMCTIGYGDIKPDSIVTKMFSILFVLVGFVFLEMLVSGMLTYVLDQNKNGRMRIRLKVRLALCVVVLCVVFGALIMHFVEKIGWFDSFYFSVMSVTTVGYGDGAFKTLPGRLLAAIWLLLSTLALVLVILFLAEARVDDRNSERAKRVLGETMSVSEFFAADIDNVGSVRKAEFVIYKLKKMEKIYEKDIKPIATQFDKLDRTNSGRITLVDLLETSTNDLSTATSV